MSFSTIIIVILAAIIIVGLFMLGMSLTYIIKGRHIDSEIGTNENMKKLGIKCTTQQAVAQDRVLRGEEPCSIKDSLAGGCSSCGSFSSHTGC